MPSHLFLPDATTEDAYANRFITIKPGGRPASCVSVPTVVAIMLDQLAAPPGDRVMGIGARTGYNAALLTKLVGPTGQVTTIDIQPDVTAYARQALDATRYDRVHVVTGDGTLGHPDRAPTTGSLSPSAPGIYRPTGPTQLTLSGRLVVRLTSQGQTRSVAFTKQETGCCAPPTASCVASSP